MSDSKQDLSALVSKILEHPELVSQITGLLHEEDAPTVAPIESEADVPTLAPKDDESESQGKNENRKKLLAALRPFLSERRRGALDSLETVATLLEITRA